MDERTGAAPWWMESTTTGEAAVSNGSRERPRKPFMMVNGRKGEYQREGKRWKNETEKTDEMSEDDRCYKGWEIDEEERGRAVGEVPKGR